MTSPGHQELQDLLGVYAINGLHDQGERDAVESHLETCQQCREDLREHREVAALLGTFPEDHPEHLWERVESALTVPPPPLRLDLVKKPLWTNRWLSVVAAAAAVLLVIGIAGVVGPAVTNRDVSEQQLAIEALEEPGSKTVELTSPDGANSVRVVMKADGSAYLYDGTLPELPDDKTYQLWGIIEERVVSLGVLGEDPNNRAFSTEPVAQTLAITVEREGGVVASTETPIVSGALPA